MSGGLTKEQEAVVNAPPTGRMLVLAGPGTGKTEVVARRLIHLLEHGLSPSRVLVLSFSRSAVRTLTSRIAKFTTAEPKRLEDLRHLAVRTFDSWAFRTLRLIGCEPSELLRLGYEANIARLVSELREGRRDEIKAQCAACQHIIVDEFQDLAGVRGALVLELLGLLAPPGRPGAGFTILGDDAQAIYGFTLRSGDGDGPFSDLTTRKLLVTLRANYGRDLAEHNLKKNFRATPALARQVEEARALLSGEVHGRTKLDGMEKILHELETMPATEVTAHKLRKEGESAALLCRTNGEALRLAAALEGNEDTPPDVSVRVTAGSPPRQFPSWIGATLGAYKAASLTGQAFGRIYSHLYSDPVLRQATGVPAQDVAWRMLLRAAGKSESDTTIDIATLRKRLDWLDALPDDEGVPDSGISILTIHQSKGMEYDFVGILESPTDEESQKRTDAVKAEEGVAEEEANVLFVALSRAARAVRVIDRDRIFPLFPRSFGPRTRWYQWGNGRVNIEVGLSTDVDSHRFVLPDQSGSASDAAGFQTYLATHAAALRGHKVVLKKFKLPGEKLRFVYDIFLQEDKKPTTWLGRCADQLSFDLLAILQGSEKKHSLPGAIYNLRIRDVITYAVEPGSVAGLPSPWKESGLWVGITIHGLGFFKTFQG